MTTRKDIARAAILNILAKGERSGRSVRQSLAARGTALSLATFYLLMSQMEDAGLVTSWDVDKIVDGISIKERWYRH
jgi:DNA-binding PadR family transcriptional regulator